MAPHLRKHTAALPKHRFFDPWNSASTGHQDADNRLSRSTAWRESRSTKLQSQFAAGLASGGGKRPYDTVGAGGPEFGQDGRTETGWDDSVQAWRGRQGVGRDQGNIGTWVDSTGKGGTEKDPEKERAKLVKGPEEVKGGYGCKRVKLSSGRPASVRKTIKSPSRPANDIPPPSAQQPPRTPPPVDSAPASSSGTPKTSPKPSVDNDADAPSKEPPLPEQPPQIFAQLSIYINGTTMPLVSDHKLRHLLTTHGAHMSIALGRRTVTHVILGKPNGGVGKGAGGGLAGSKIEKEVLRRGGSGNGIRYVSVDW